MTNPLVRRIGLALAAPALAAVFAVVVSAIVLELSGSNSIDTFGTILSNGFQLETFVDTLNRATPLFLAGVAAAIGFRMNLFNIGVEGQYILAAFAAAVVGAELNRFALPGFLHTLAIVATAMFVGAVWAGLSGLLKVTRGINEVISTIMLNFVATGGIVAALLPKVITDPTAPNQGTETIAERAWLPDLNGVAEVVTREIGRGRELTGVFLIAVVVAIAYHVGVNRTVFGFDLRSSGMNPFAAFAGGVQPKKMVFLSMVLSGVVAGLVGMPEILSDNHAYDQGFVQGLGFGGIAIALLGRNSALGMTFAALLFGFLDSSSAVLQVQASASAEIVRIMQATFLLAAVVAFEFVNRIRQRDEVARASAATETPNGPTPSIEGASA